MIELAGALQSPQDRDNLEIQQFRRRQSTLGPQASPDPVSVRAVVSEGDGDNAGVNDDRGRAE